MHPYSTDSTERKTVTIYIGIVAVLLVWAFERFAVQIPWMTVPTISTFAVAGGLYVAFQRWVWKLLIVQWLGVAKTPDLSGSWEGGLYTSHDEHSDAIPIEVTIRQNWTRMAVRLKTKTSTSHSRTASLFVNRPQGTTLSYQYQNEPRADAPEVLSTHSGGVNLVLEGDDVLDGSYYTGRGRGNYGRIRIERK